MQFEYFFNKTIYYKILAIFLIFLISIFSLKYILYIN